MNAKYLSIFAIYGLGLIAMIYGDQDIALFLLTWAGWTLLAIMVLAVMDREVRENASNSSDT